MESELWRSIALIQEKLAQISASIDQLKSKIRALEADVQENANVFGELAQICETFSIE